LSATDVEGSPLTYAIVTGPAHGALTGVAPALTYTPAANYNGIDSFTFTANDGSLDSNIGTVSITVAGVNDAPVAVNDSYSTNEDAPLTVAAPGVLGNDTDIDSPTLTAIVVAGPAHGTLTLNPDGSFLYTPAANFNGSDTFTYKVTDGSLESNTATVALTINAVNDAPVAVADNYLTNEDTPLTMAAPGVLVNDTDVDGTTLTAVLVTGPSHGTLTLTGDGSFSYTPAANFNGTDTFTYTASDGSSSSAAATVSILVNAVNDAPIVANDSYTMNEDTPLTVAAPGVLGNDTDVDSATLTAVLVAGPAHGVLSGAAPALTYTPAANYNGSDSFTFKANDGSLDSNIATVTIAVAPVNDAPVANSDTATTAEDTAVTIAVLTNDTDVDGD